MYSALDIPKHVEKGIEEGILQDTMNIVGPAGTAQGSVVVYYVITSMGKESEKRIDTCIRVADSLWMSTWDSDIHVDHQQDLLYNTGTLGQYYVVTYGVVQMVASASPRRPWGGKIS